MTQTVPRGIARKSLNKQEPSLELSAHQDDGTPENHYLHCHHHLG